MPARIFKRVLLPAPLRPITPTTSPRGDVEGEAAAGPRIACAAAGG